MSEQCPICRNNIYLTRGARGSQGVDENGDPYPFWTDDPIKTLQGLSGQTYAGTDPFRWVHIKELQNYYNLIEEEVGIATTSWTDTVSGTTPIRKTHIIEIRIAIESLLTELGKTLADYFGYDRLGNVVSTTQTEWTDVDRSSGYPLIPNGTPLRAINIEELRRGLFVTLYPEQGFIKTETLVVSYDGVSTVSGLFSGWLAWTKEHTHSINDYQYGSEVYPTGSHIFHNQISEIYYDGSPVIPIFESLEETDDNFKFKVTSAAIMTYSKQSNVELYIKLTPEEPGDTEYASAYVPFSTETTNRIYTTIWDGGPFEPYPRQALATFFYQETHIIYIPTMSFRYPYLKFNSVSCDGWSVDLDWELDYPEDKHLESPHYFTSGDGSTVAGGIHVTIQNDYWGLGVTELYYKVIIRVNRKSVSNIPTGYWYNEDQYDPNVMRPILEGMSQWEFLSGGFIVSMTAKGDMSKEDKLYPFDYTVIGDSL